MTQNLKQIFTAQIVTHQITFTLVNLARASSRLLSMVQGERSINTVLLIPELEC